MKLQTIPAAYAFICKLATSYELNNVFGPSYEQLLCHYSQPVSRETNEQKFYSLAETWKSDTSYTSSVSKMVTHPAYLQIISMGKEVVPMLLRELEERPDHWFLALNVITHADPVPSSDRGRVAKMTEAWLDWGHSQGYEW